MQEEAYLRLGLVTSSSLAGRETPGFVIPVQEIESFTGGGY
jgi:hypothetical protein